MKCEICDKSVTKALVNISRALYVVNGTYHPDCYKPIHERRYGGPAKPIRRVFA
jgi:hypothetical protein